MLEEQLRETELRYEEKLQVKLYTTDFSLANVTSIIGTIKCTKHNLCQFMTRNVLVIPSAANVVLKQQL